MKKSVHPEFYASAKVTCTACGAVFLIPGTVKEQQTEICSNCHPIYTGKYRGVVSSGRVERFQKKLAAAKNAPAKIAKKKLTAEEKLEKKLAVKRKEKKEKAPKKAKKK
jgi:large subunit ribosomal protein L31